MYLPKNASFIDLQLPIEVINKNQLFQTCRGVPRIWQGGGGKNFFFRFGNLHVAKPCDLLGGFGGMLPREIFLKWCNMVRFGVYFDQILSLKNFKNYHFLYKNFENCNFLYKNCNFLYKRIDILDIRLLWGKIYSREGIF